ncbi:MAG: bifunctional precorrin-2 dehydrogenase/sirohydrochlorin ferrochelatase [Succinivibrionaceae bacterium]
MRYFPLFINLENEKVLVVGAGDVASRKVLSLLEFGADVEVVSPKISSNILDINNKNLKIHCREFLEKDIFGKKIVFVATDEKKLNTNIAKICRSKGILVNVADIPSLCDFYFPSVVTRGELVVGITSSGKSPALSKCLRENIDNFLPEDLGEYLELLSVYRKNSLMNSQNPLNNRDYKELLDKIVCKLKMK